MKQPFRKPSTLGELLRRRTNELVLETQSPDGALDEERLASLERLSRLHQLQTSLEEPQRHRRWGGIALLVAVTIVASLYERRLPHTSVSGEMLVRELSMEVGEEQPIIPGKGLSYLSIAGLDSVRLPSGDEGARTVAAQTVTLLVDSSAANPGTLDLDEWVVPAKTAIRVLATDLAGTHGWMVDYPDDARPFQISAIMSGPIFATIDGRADSLVTQFGAPVEYYASSAVLVTTSHTDTISRVLPPIPVARALAFNQRFRYKEPYRELSSILGGSVLLEDLNSREVKLGPGQSLRFATSEMEVPHLALERGGIRIRFSGAVEGMSTGTGQQRNLMPRMLERLAKSPALLLIGSTVLTLFGYLLGLRKWLQKTD
jgi:hypothetical protein